MADDSRIDSFSQDSQLRKYIAEYDAPITNEDVTNLTKSKPYLEGASIIELADTGATISRRQFTPVRDYLLCQLTLATGTGTGTGALNNVLLSDYETSRVSEGNQIFLVPKHKRTKDGPAMLWMDPLMQREMEHTRLKPGLPSLTLTRRSSLLKTTEPGSPHNWQTCCGLLRAKWCEQQLCCPHPHLRVYLHSDP